MKMTVNWNLFSSDVQEQKEKQQKEQEIQLLNEFWMEEYMKKLARTTGAK